MAQVRIRYFAAVREMVGLDAETVDIAEGDDAADLFSALVERHDRLRDGLRRHLRVARNLEFVDWSTPLQDGDEIAFIPPVSGGSAAQVRMTKEVLSLDAVVSYVSSAQHGAVATFSGVVRDHTGDRDVVRLEYDAYEDMALAQLQRTVDLAQQKWPVVAAVHHRYGTLQIGELAVVIAVGSAHRADAFEACRFIIEELKREVPIWKKEISADGAEWIGRGP